MHLPEKSPAHRRIGNIRFDRQQRHKIERDLKAELAPLELGVRQLATFDLRQQLACLSLISERVGDELAEELGGDHDVSPTHELGHLILICAWRDCAAKRCATRGDVLRRRDIQINNLPRSVAESKKRKSVANITQKVPRMRDAEAVSPNAIPA